jgi:serine phosphatase RsbU (regulator of sigma subunit)
MAQSEGRPFFQNFPPRKYKGDGQTWSGTQDGRGLIYIGHTSGILEYDGVEWSKIRTPDDQRPGHMATGSDGRVYAIIRSGDREFGYLEPNEAGELKYISFAPLLDSLDTLGFLEKVHNTPQGITYVGQEALVRVTSKDSLKVIPQENSILRSFLIYDKIIGITRNSYTMVQPDGSQEEMPGGEEIRSTGIIFLTGDNADGFLGLTGRGKLYKISKDGDLTYLPNNMEDYLSENRVRTMELMPNGNIAVGTNAGGIVVLGRDGSLKNTLTKDKDGIVDNSTYATFMDSQGGLWVMTGNGIFRVELNSPFTHWYSEVGGWVVAVNSYKDNIYSGALGGRVLTPNGFEVVDGLDISVQSWSMYNYMDKMLLYGNSDGLYKIIEQKKAEPVYLNGTVHAILPDIYNPERIYLGKTAQIAVLDWNRATGNWDSVTVIEEIEGEVRSLVQDEDGTLWAGTYEIGVYHLTFSDLENLEIEKINHFGTKDGLPTKKYNRVNLVDDQIVFSTAKGLYRFNGSSFEPDPKFKVYNDLNRNAFLVVQDVDDVWIAPFKTDKHPLGKLIKTDTGYVWFETPFRRLPSMETENLYPDDKGNLWIAGSIGLVKYNSHGAKNYSQDINTYLRMATFGDDSVYYAGGFIDQSVLNIKENRPEVDYANNSVTFNYAVTAYEDEPDANLYSYKLEGYEEEWSPYVKASSKDYTNLPPGEYTFKVKGKNAYGLVGSEASYAFRIIPPWYRTIWAYLGYVILLALIIYISIRLFSRNLRKQNEKLEAIVDDRTKEIAMEKDRVERAYGNIQVLNDIGQQITSALTPEDIIKTVYRNVNQLMDATAFGIGLYNEEKNRLDFPGFMERNKELKFSSDTLSEESTLASYCFNQRKDLFLNDTEKEFHNHIDPKYDFNFDIQREKPKSALYVPLVYEEEAIGVLTVQSMVKNAYKEMDLTILKNLASYISIALKNAQSFDTIKEQNYQLTDSIRYAETIQQAVLPSMERFNEVLDDYFVIFKPKDIVSGDFYWLNKKEEKVYFAVADCTGHGVPGAFMSMIGTAFLNEIVNAENIQRPGKILSRLHEHVRFSLQQAEKKNSDGMDIGLICLEKSMTMEDKIKVTFSGAKIPLFIARGNELYEVKGDRKSIGGLQREEKRTFTEKEIYLEENDQLFLASDGFVDQNNPLRKKIGTPRLKDILSQGLEYPLIDQQERLVNELQTHQQDALQRDDITIVGIQL